MSFLMQIASSRIWTCVTGFISYDDKVFMYEPILPYEQDVTQSHF